MDIKSILICGTSGNGARGFVLESNQYGRMEVTVKPKKDISLEEQLKEVIPSFKGRLQLENLMN